MAHFPDRQNYFLKIILSVIYLFYFILLLCFCECGWWKENCKTERGILFISTSFIYTFFVRFFLQRYTGAGHIIRISSKSWFISLIPFKKWNLYNVYIHSTQTDIFQVFISFNFDDYKWQLMKTPNSVSQKIRILWKGSILKTPGATL